MAAPDSLNPSSGPGVPPTGKGWLAGWTSQHTAWLLFGPPALMAAVRWLLQSISERQSGTPAPPLAPVSTTASSLELLWPVAVVLAGLAVAGWVLYRIGRRRSLPVLGAAWLVLWLWGSAAMVQRHLNREGLFLQPGVSMPAGATPVRASVVTSQFKKPNLHSLGGTELVLQVSGLQVPQRLLIDDPQAVLLRPGDALALRLVSGRFSGSFVTGWQPQPPAAPASAPESASASEPAPAVVGPAVPAVPASAASH